jgi:SAM-dependent methyltransferase
MEALLRLKSQRSRIENIKKASKSISENAVNNQPDKNVQLDQSNSSVKGKSELRQRLESGEFRWINEQLYTCSGEDAFKLFSEDPELFDKYHAGFRNQVRKWPFDPLEEIIKIMSNIIQNADQLVTIADLGCGEARLGKVLSEKFKDRAKVHSFDLVAANDRIVACDIASLPLKDLTVDHAIFCLSLMGTNFVKFLLEASRILKSNGILHIAEVESRFTNLVKFEELLVKLGFNLVTKKQQKFFFIFEFRKIDSIQMNPKLKKKLIKTGSDLLKPCLYKKR